MQQKDSSQGIQALIDAVDDLQDYVRRQIDRVWDHLSLMHESIGQVGLDVDELIEELYSKPE